MFHSKMKMNNLLPHPTSQGRTPVLRDRSTGPLQVHGISIGSVNEHNIFAQILNRTVHLYYSTVYFKSYLSYIGRATSAYEADISVTFYD